MFEELIESKAVPARSLRQTAVSATIHLVLIAAAVRVSQGAAASITERLTPEVVFLREAPPPPPPPVKPLPTTATPPKVVPRGFTVLAAPHDIPTTIPPVDLTATFNSKAYDGVGVAGGLPDGVIGVTSIAEVVGSAAYSADQVDDPVQIQKQPEPKYPQALRAAGITGTVVIEYVVGVDGRAESASIKVVSATNERFETAAIETIRGSSFKPAKVRGIAVRQLVRQSINFAMLP